MDPRRLRIVVLLHGQRTLVLYAESAEQAREWTVALAKAADLEAASVDDWRDADPHGVVEVTSMRSFVVAEREAQKAFSYRMAV